MTRHRYLDLSNRLNQVVAWVAFGAAITVAVLVSGTLAPAKRAEFARHDTTAPGHDPETCLACGTLRKPFPRAYGDRLVKEAILAKSQSVPAEAKRPQPVTTDRRTD
jgi:hypothetical protein